MATELSADNTNGNEHPTMVPFKPRCIVTTSSQVNQWLIVRYDVIRNAIISFSFAKINQSHSYHHFAAHIMTLISIDLWRILTSLAAILFFSKTEWKDFEIYWETKFD